MCLSLTKHINFPEDIRNKPLQQKEKKIIVHPSSEGYSEPQSEGIDDDDLDAEEELEEEEQDEELEDENDN